MMDYTIVDTTFGVGNQALAVLHMLDREPAFADYSEPQHLYQVSFSTRPWYNGRERGICISMTNSYAKNNKYFHIAIFEHRNDYSICALTWETDKPYWNHPLEDKNLFEIAYKGKGKGCFDFSVREGEIGKMADWVYEQLSHYYKNHLRLLEGIK